MKRLVSRIPLVALAALLALMLVPGMALASVGPAHGGIGDLSYTQFGPNSYFGLHGVYTFSASGQGVYHTSDPALDGATVVINQSIRFLPDSATTFRGSTQGDLTIGSTSAAFNGSLQGSFAPTPTGYEATMQITAATTDGDSLTLDLTITSDAYSQPQAMWGSGTVDAAGRAGK